MNIAVVTWEILRSPITIPDLHIQHSGSTIDVMNLLGPLGLEYISGTNAATDLGEYEITVAPDGNHCWSDRSTGERTLSWMVCNLVAIPTQKGTLTYSGSSQGPEWNNYNTNYMSETRIVQTNAGTYYTTFTLKPYHVWTDKTTAPKEIPWTIGKATGYITLSSTSGTVDNGKTITFTVKTKHPDAALTVSSSSTARSTAAISGTTVTVTGKGTAGASTITVTAEATTNYKAASATFSVTTYLASLTVPTIATKTYTGSALTPAWTNLDTAKMSTSPASTTQKTNAGSYSWTVTPNSGYRWSDNTTSAKTVTWKINRKALTVPAQSGTLTYNGSSQTPSFSNYNSAQLTKSGTTSGTNATSYTATFTPTANYEWSDGTTGAKSVTWTIGKATGAITINSTSAMSLTIDALKGTRTVSTNNGGTLSVTSSSTGVAITELSGSTATIYAQGNGSATITVKVTGGNSNYTTPANKTFTVNTSGIPSKTLANVSWANIKKVVQQNVATKFWSVGALSPWVELRGQFGLHNLNPYKCNFRVVNIENNALIFQLARHSGNREIAFTDYQYGNCIATNEKGYCMNRRGMLRNTVDSSLTDSEKTFGSNKGGYYNSYGGRELMGELNATIPQEIQEIWTLARLYHDGGQGNTTTSGIKYSDYGIWLPSQIEIFGHTTGMNSNLANYTKQFQWYAAGNKPEAKGTDRDTTLVQWWLRDASIVFPQTDFRIVNTDGTNRQESAARSEGMKPCFKVAG